MTETKGNGAQKTIEDNRNIFITANQTLASVGLDKLGKSGYGNLVAPATWLVDNRVNGNTPGLNDIGIWLTGVFISGGASTITGFWKAKVDDSIAMQFKQAVAKEPTKVAQHMEPCYNTFYGPPQINAIKFASKGGTAWQHPNGLWICVKDADGRPVIDYEPKNYKTLIRPKFPLVKGTNGLYRYDTFRK